MTLAERTPYFHALQPWPICQSAVLAFRSACARLSPLPDIPSSDIWDERSRHFILATPEKNILGVARISNSVAGRLPLSQAFPDLEIGENEREISRLLVFPDKRHGRIFSMLLDDIFHILEQENKCTWIDVCSGGIANVKLARYEKLGFHKTGPVYFDQHYSAPSYLMCRPSL